jgi:hypothetical protein
MLTTLLFVFALPGCSSSQGTPGDTIESFFARIEDQEYGDACELIAPDLRRVMATFAGPCPNAVADQYGDFRDVEVDASLITVTGDIAEAPAEAITANGRLIDDEDISLAKIDRKWYISGGG